MEDELVALLLAPLCSSVDRRFRQLVRIHKQSPDIAGGLHVGKDDLNVVAGDQGTLFGYAGDETDETKVRSLMIGLDAVSVTSILYELKIGEVDERLRGGDRGVHELGFHRVGRRRPGQGPLLWRHFCQGTNCLIHVVKQ